MVWQAKNNQRLDGSGTEDDGTVGAGGNGPGNEWLMLRQDGHRNASWIIMRRGRLADKVKTKESGNLHQLTSIDDGYNTSLPYCRCLHCHHAQCPTTAPSVPRTFNMSLLDARRLDEPHLADQWRRTSKTNIEPQCGAPDYYIHQQPPAWPF